MAVISVTPDALFVRTAESAGGTAGGIICAKTGFTACACLAITLVNVKCRVRSIAAGLTAGPKRLFLVSFFQALIQVGFPMAFLLTSAARALLLISMNPLWAAVLARVFLKEKVAAVTLLALAFAIVSALVVFVPPLMVASTTAESSDGANASATAEASSQQYSVAGDLISIATGLCLASFLVSSRWAAAVLPDVALSTTPVVANTAVSVCMLPLLLTE